MTTKRNNWRVTQEHARRKAALVSIVESVDNRPQDRITAEGMLQSLAVNTEAYREGQRALQEVAGLTREVSRLQAELADARVEIERLKNDLREALDLVEGGGVPNAG